jgi:hypothetical protein
MGLLGIGIGRCGARPLLAAGCHQHFNLKCNGEGLGPQTGGRCQLPKYKRQHFVTAFQLNEDSKTRRSNHLEDRSAMRGVCH